MRKSMGGRLLVAGILVWALIGCGSAVEGEAEPLSGQEGLFDPCTDIPDSAIRGVGLDPYTKEVDIAGVEIPGWKICTWSGDWYFVAIFSNIHSINDIRNHPEYGNLVAGSVGSRQGVMFTKVDDLDGDSCYIAAEVSQGSIWLRVNRKGLRAVEEPTCGLAQNYVDQLEGFWPH